RAARQPMLAILIQGDDLHRDVTRQRILLELAEDGPTQYVGKEHVEGDRGRPELLGKRQRVGAFARDQNLEAVLLGKIDKDMRVVRLVPTNKQHGISGLDRHPIIGNRLGHTFIDDGWHLSGRLMQAAAIAWHWPERRRTAIDQGQVKPEAASHAWSALQANFTAEQVSKLAADGKPEARAAIFSARAGIGLLEGFEDDLLLVLGYADARIRDLEGRNHRRLAENRVIGSPSVIRRRDLEPYASLLL